MNRSDTLEFYYDLMNMAGEFELDSQMEIARDLRVVALHVQQAYNLSENEILNGIIDDDEPEEAK